MIGSERNKVHYVWAAQTGSDTARTLLRRVILDLPLGLIPPPQLELHEPSVGPQPFVCAGDGTQAEIGRLYGVAQQTVGRWIAYTEQYDVEQARPEAVEARRLAEARRVFGPDVTIEAMP